MIHAVTALSFLVFFVFYLVLKAWYFQKQYGINPLAALQGGFDEKLLWFALPLVFVGYGVVAWMALSEPMWSVGAVMVGFMIMIFGFILMVAAQIQMGTNWRMGLEQRGKIDLVQTGLFGVSRNPVYVGLLVQALGVTIVFLSLYTLLLFFILFSLFLLIVLQEEKFLHGLFGDEYVRYRRKVRRFL